MALSGRTRSLLRATAFQASWNYERMQGVGMAWASLPLLEPLAASDPPRHREAVARASEFFNANPFLAGAAVGATAREELDGAPGDRIERLRTALCGPLGALGDQLFWLGTVPGLAALGVLAVAVGAGWWAVALVVLAHATIRFAVGTWALDLGLAQGTRVGAAIQSSWLPRGVEWSGRVAAVLVGMAIPVATWWLLAPAPLSRRWLALALALAFYRLAGRVRGRFSPVEFTLAAMALVFLWHWSSP